MPGGLTLASPNTGVCVLEARRGLWSLGARELWRFRDLLLILAGRDVRVRYKQTLLGVAWAVLQPFMTMVVLSVVFGRLLGIESSVEGVPYPVFLFSGLILWTLFASSVTTMSQSLVTNASMLRKVYFPRLLAPLASMGVPLVDFTMSMVVLLGLCLWYGVGLSWGLLAAPLLVMVVVLGAAGVGLWLAALSVTYRDVRYVVPFMIQLWFFVSPVIVGVGVVPERYRWLAQLNPVCGPIEGLRALVVGGSGVPWPGVLLSCLSGLACLVAGLWYFGRTERRFADVA